MPAAYPPAASRAIFYILASRAFLFNNRLVKNAFPLMLACLATAGCATDNHNQPWQPGIHGAISYLGNWAQGRPRNPVPTRPDVAYGTHERQVFDFWQATGEGPRPIFVYFHGGGFDWGNKWELKPGVIRACLKNGISVASCNYRLIHSGPLPQPLLDGARAVQFLRANATEFNIDPARVAGGGFSAGGLIALWLAGHDDLADPASKDPLTRQSTRLVCAAVSDAPTNLHAAEVYDWFNVPILKEFPSTKLCFDIQSLDELNKPRVIKLARESSPIHHVTPDDPPVYLSYSRSLLPVTKRTGPFTWVHHPMFGVKMRESLKTAGIECVLHYRHSEPPTQYRDGVDFVAQKLGVKKADPTPVQPAPSSIPR